MAGLGQDLTLDSLPPVSVTDVVSGSVASDPFSLTSLESGISTVGSDISNFFFPDSLNPNNSSIGTSTAGSTSSGSTVAQDIAALGPALAAAAKGVSAASGPYAIPNSNYIYNPATGQILLNGAAVGTYNPTTGALTAIGSVNLPMLLGLGVAVLLVVMLMGRK